MDGDTNTSGEEAQGSGGPAAECASVTAAAEGSGECGLTTRQGKSKDKKEKRPRRKVVWDEGNLTYNEEHKTATMKIDEPKTPFHELLPDGEEEALEDHAAAADQTSLIQAKLASVALHSAEADPEGGPSGEPTHEDSTDGEGRGAVSGASDLVDDGSADDAGDVDHKDEFQEHRRKHYDEFQRVKDLKALLAKNHFLDDEDVDV